MGGALGRLFALSEAYPDLKANQNMMQLQEELTSTENKVAFARQAYNDAVTSYNTKREQFPGRDFWPVPSGSTAELFEVEDRDGARRRRSQVLIAESVRMSARARRSGRQSSAAIRTAATVRAAETSPTAPP